MIFGPPGRQSLVSEEFNILCTKMRVEVRVSPSANPGDPYNALRILNFRNYNNSVIVIRQCNRRKTVTKIPPNGEAQIMLLPQEELPSIERDQV